MNAPAAVRVQHLLPQRLVCGFIYFVSRSRIRWFKDALIGWFARQYRIDLDEALEPNPSAYGSFNEFFARALRAGARDVDDTPGAIVSPADGTLTQLGTIEHGRLVQAKGFDYSLGELLGEPEPLPAAFAGGTAATIYLAPHNYHRVHCPYAGRLSAMRYIAGKRFSVNATTARWIERLYCRNERLICWFETDIGRIAVVLVGALNVSSISTSITGEIRSGSDFHQTHANPAPFACGEEFARFNLGSTVIVVLPRGAAEFVRSVHAGQAVRMGERIATASAMTQAR